VSDKHCFRVTGLQDHEGEFLVDCTEYVLYLHQVIFDLSDENLDDANDDDDFFTFNFEDNNQSYLAACQYIKNYQHEKDEKDEKADAEVKVDEPQPLTHAYFLRSRARS
jgi:hypothetical protein